MYPLVSASIRGVSLRSSGAYLKVYVVNIRFLSVEFPDAYVFVQNLALLLTLCRARPYLTELYVNGNSSIVGAIFNLLRKSSSV